MERQPPDIAGKPGLVARPRRGRSSSCRAACGTASFVLASAGQRERRREAGSPGSRASCALEPGVDEVAVRTAPEPVGAETEVGAVVALLDPARPCDLVPPAAPLQPLEGAAGPGLLRNLRLRSLEAVLRRQRMKVLGSLQKARSRATRAGMRAGQTEDPSASRSAMSSQKPPVRSRAMVPSGRAARCLGAPERTVGIAEARDERDAALDGHAGALLPSLPVRPGSPPAGPGWAVHR